MSNFTRLQAKTDIMDHAIFCRQYLRHAHKKVPLICEKHLPTKYSGYATDLGDQNELRKVKPRVGLDCQKWS